jgi:hypothetical protein
MSESIGTAAGKIWSYLDESGPASATKITKLLAAFRLAAVL